MCKDKIKAHEKSHTNGTAKMLKKRPSTVNATINCALISSAQIVFAIISSAIITSAPVAKPSIEFFDLEAKGAFLKSLACKLVDKLTKIEC